VRTSSKLDPLSFAEAASSILAHARKGIQVYGQGQKLPMPQANNVFNGSREARRYRRQAFLG
jgi:hypothetical protein